MSTASKESATKGKGEKDGEKTDDVCRSNVRPTKKTRTSQGSGDPDTVTVTVGELQEVYQLASPSCNVTMITESDKSTTSQVSPSTSSSRMTMEVESGATSEEIEPANLGLESDTDSSSSTDSDGKHQI